MAPTLAKSSKLLPVPVYSLPTPKGMFSLPLAFPSQCCSAVGKHSA